MYEMTVELEHRRLELARRRALINAERAWMAGTAWNGGYDVDLSGVRRALRSAVLSVVNLF